MRIYPNYRLTVVSHNEVVASCYFHPEDSLSHDSFAKVMDIIEGKAGTELDWFNDDGDTVLNVVRIDSAILGRIIRSLSSEGHDMEYASALSLATGSDDVVMEIAVCELVEMED